MRVQNKKKKKTHIKFIKHTYVENFRFKDKHHPIRIKANI